MNVSYLRFLAGLGAVVAAVWVAAGETWGAVTLGTTGVLVAGLEFVTAGKAGRSGK